MNHTTVVEEIRFPSGEFDLYGRLRRRGTPAPTMLLLCGIGFHTFEYEPLAGQLADRGISSFSFDYRGHGRSTGRRGTWRLADLVRDTSAAIDALHKGRPRSVRVFGNSLGAMVAILAGTYDARVGAVAACNAPAHVADFTLNRPRRILFAAAKARIGGTQLAERLSWIQ